MAKEFSNAVKFFTYGVCRSPDDHSDLPTIIGVGLGN